MHMQKKKTPPKTKKISLPMATETKAEIQAQVLLFPFMGIQNESENMPGHVHNV